MQPSVVKRRGISTVNGPVSLSVHSSPSKTIYIFGDGHGSKENRYQGDTVSMNKNKTNLVGLGAEAIDIDAMFHIWCSHNAKEGITTDVFYERPATSRTLPGEENAGWMYDVTSLFRSNDERSANLKRAVYSQSVRCRSIDIRYGEQGTQDIFTWVQEVVVASDVSPASAKNAVKLAVLVMENYEDLLAVYTNEDEIEKLRAFRRKVVSSDLGSIKKQTLEVLDSMLLSSRKVRIAVGALRLKDEHSANILVKYIREQVSLNVSQAKESMFDDGLLEAFLDLVDTQPQEAMDAYSQIGADISDSFLYSGALVMDIYSLSLALGSDCKEVLIYVGARHALTYGEILFQIETWKLEKQILPDVYSDRVSRYISNSDLISVLALGPKINVLRRGRPSYLDIVEGRISDYNLAY